MHKDLETKIEHLRELRDANNRFDRRGMDDAVVVFNAVIDGKYISADIYWQLLRSLEEHVGSKAGALDKDLIKQAYNHYNKVMGTDLKPSYL